MAVALTHVTCVPEMTVRAVGVKPPAVSVITVALVALPVREMVDLVETEGMPGGATTAWLAPDPDTL